MRAGVCQQKCFRLPAGGPVFERAGDIIICNPSQLQKEGLRLILR